MQQLLNYTPIKCRNLKPDAVPTLNLPGGSQVKNQEERSLRLNQRRRRTEVNEILKEANFIQSRSSDNQDLTVKTEIQLPTEINIEQIEMDIDQPVE